MKTHLSTLGIILTTIGSFLVWKYLTELNWADKDAFLKGKGVMTIPSPSEAGVKKFKYQLWMSKLGLGLIVFSGAVQIISNYWYE